MGGRKRIQLMKGKRHNRRRLHLTHTHTHARPRAGSKVFSTVFLTLTRETGLVPVDAGRTTATAAVAPAAPPTLAALAAPSPLPALAPLAALPPRAPVVPLNVPLEPAPLPAVPPFPPTTVVLFP